MGAGFIVRSYDPNGYFVPCRIIFTGTGPVLEYWNPTASPPAWAQATGKKNFMGVTGVTQTKSGGSSVTGGYTITLANSYLRYYCAAANWECSRSGTTITLAEDGSGNPLVQPEVIVTGSAAALTTQGGGSIEIATASNASGTISPAAPANNTVLALLLFVSDQNSF